MKAQERSPAVRLIIALALCRPEARFPLRAQVQQMFEKRQVPHSQRHRLCEILLADNEPEADYLENGAGPFVTFARNDKPGLCAFHRIIVVTFDDVA